MPSPRTLLSALCAIGIIPGSVGFKQTPSSTPIVSFPSEEAVSPTAWEWPPFTTFQTSIIPGTEPTPLNPFKVPSSNSYSSVDEEAALLVPRAIPTPPPKEEEPFINWIYRLAREDKLLPKDESVHGMSTSKTYDLGENPLKFGQEEIRGCTILSVVSKYAVYQAHLWEVPSMRIKEGGRFVPNENAFQQNILDYLDHDNELRKPQLKGTGDNGEYPDAAPQVYMFTPKSRTGRDQPQYKEEVNRINEKVKAALGLPATKEPEIFNYQKPGTNAVSVLFMYDPNDNDAGDGCKKEAAWNAWWGGRFNGPVFAGQLN